MICCQICLLPPCCSDQNKHHQNCLVTKLDCVHKTSVYTPWQWLKGKMFQRSFPNNTCGVLITLYIDHWLSYLISASKLAVFSHASFYLHRTNLDTTADVNHTMVTKAPIPQQDPHTQTHNETDSEPSTQPKMNGVNSLETPPPSTPCSEQKGKRNDGRRGEDEGGGPCPNDTSHLNHHPNGWGKYGPPNSMPYNSNGKLPPTRTNSGHRPAQGHLEDSVGPLHDPREQEENVVLRRGFVPRTAPERVAQRKSSMAQLQQWVNQRRGMASQEDINR